ncbi:hypothetical protein D7T50_03850 [Stenotrophomonas maltophilia]|nr:hypothetical protein [Stenotrophomonas maltophilia]MBA0479783.1 hypothetical protein [Stenotrophomonas maltophilia]MBA0488007.1 hypothetical protein [Stenotrophomonas maltophilia]MBA0492068.1 hypothetical protein [Stenotrophomonas maltophilia]
MATHHAHRSKHRRRGLPSASARQAMELAALALTDAVPGLIGEEAMAERERIRQRQEQQDNRQHCLPLGNPDVPSKH